MRSYKTVKMKTFWLYANKFNELIKLGYKVDLWVIQKYYKIKQKKWKPYNYDWGIYLVINPSWWYIRFSTGSWTELIPRDIDPKKYENLLEDIQKFKKLKIIDTPKKY